MTKREILIKEANIFFENRIKNGKLSTYGIDATDIDNFAQEMNMNGHLNIYIEDICRGQNDYYLQACVWVDTKPRSMTVIFDYEVTSSFNTIEEMVDEMITLEEQGQKIIDQLKDIKLDF